MRALGVCRDSPVTVSSNGTSQVVIGEINGEVELLEIISEAPEPMPKGLQFFRIGQWFEGVCLEFAEGFAQGGFAAEFGEIG